MARVEKIDRTAEQRLDEFEQRLFVLKIEYDKYFNGVERIEPSKERDDLRRLIKDIEQSGIRATRQLHKMRSLKARFSSMELFWTRNLLQIERGTHPKQQFRARLHEEARGVAPPPSAEAPRPRRQSPEERQEAAFREVYDEYVTTRRSCGQAGDLSFEAVRDVLSKQVATIKSRYACADVKLRVTVEDGKAKVKAVPQR